MTDTITRFDEIISKCRELYEGKTRDYGTAWRILRLPSLTDQIYIKANRIRSIQEKGEQRVEDSVENEFVGIINYCVMALIQANDAKHENRLMELPLNLALLSYDRVINDIRELLENKNHDYGEAWRNMRVSSMTDLILMKLLRIKQIEDNEGKTEVSEGVEAGYMDIINYAVFCLIVSEDAESFVKKAAKTLENVDK